MKVIDVTNKTSQDFNLIIKALKKGELLAAPTDTVYGLLGDARSEALVERIHQFKNRPFGMGVSIFVKDLAMAKKYVEINQHQEKVIKQLTPGKFTFILKSLNNLPQGLYDQRKTLGVRIVENELIKDIFDELDFPLTATSANLHGRGNILSSDVFQLQIPQKKLDQILYLIKGSLAISSGSTVIDLSNNTPKILRHGKLLATYESENEDQSILIAQSIWEKFNKIFAKNVVIILEGDLGSGKTVFVKAIGQLLGLDGIQSPSYQILREYNLRKSDERFQHFVHGDLYFFESDNKFADIGLDHYLDNDSNLRSIVLLEWGELGGVFLQKYPHLRVKISRDKDQDNYRKFEVYSHLL